MKSSKFTEQQIITILKEVEVGVKVKDTCRKYGLSDAPYYKWKSAYAGMEVSQLHQLRELHSENARLKKMYADLAWCILPCRTLSAERFSPGAQS